MRGRSTKLREYNGKEVKPVLYMDPDKNARYVAGAFEDGSFAVDPATKMPIPYKKI